MSVIEPYASHMPVLKAMCAYLHARRVLELGAGIYSSTAFLETADLEKLVSVENDPAWARRATTNDPRHELILVNGAIADHIPPLEGFDLVFIDDSVAAEDRVRTIQAVLGQAHPPVILHDAENVAYAAVVAEMSPVPATAVVL